MTTAVRGASRTRCSKPAVLPHVVVAVAALVATATACRAPKPEEVRLQARPSTPAAPIAPGTHALGLGSMSLRWGWRDGRLHVPGRARSGSPVPLLVLLHGGGGRESDFHFAFPIAEEFGVALVTLDSRDNTWDAIDSPWGPDVKSIDAALRRTFASVAIDPSRLALGGASDGGFYALSLGVVNGDLFTHLVAVAPGYMAPPAPSVGRPRVFLAHGSRDRVYSVSSSRRLVPSLKDGGYDVLYREYDAPHSMTVPMLRDVLEWLVGQDR